MKPALVWIIGSLVLWAVLEVIHQTPARAGWRWLISGLFIWLSLSTVALS